jgi:CRISPR-associated protein Csx17
MHDHLLTGCTPIPLAHYLKALGILRLVSTQKDPQALGRWSGEHFELSTSLSREGLLQFFLEEYRPTPVLAPWNNGSGFFPKDNKDGVDPIMASPHPRFAPFVEAIDLGRQVLERLGSLDKPDDAKPDIIESCRASWSETALEWMDAAVLMTASGLAYPPLLGTGGNDGRLDFTNNFMQRLTDVISPADGSPTEKAAHWLTIALFAPPMPDSGTPTAIGQFAPGMAGGYNGSTGFTGRALVNPWDYILMIEGALLFSAAVSKRLESNTSGALVYPFCVRQAGTGYTSAAPVDEVDSRSEIWMPLWTGRTTFSEAQAIFSEGRTIVHGRAARTGLDFIQAIASLGVERGISAFQRYGFQKRNGEAYFAVALDRVQVRRNAHVGLLSDLSQSNDALRLYCRPGGKRTAPGRIASACRALDEAMYRMAREGDRRSVLHCLRVAGQVEKAIAASRAWTKEAGIAPLQGLRPDWLDAIGEASTEFRLAAALAGSHLVLGVNTRLHFRQHLEQVNMGTSHGRTWVRWSDEARNDVVWHDGDPVDALGRIMARRLMRVQQAGVDGWPERSPVNARLDDIAAFIEGRIDEDLFTDLLWGLTLIDWEKVAARQQVARSRSTAPPSTPLTAAERTDEPGMAVPSSFFALLRLCYQHPRISQVPIPPVPAIARLAMSGDGDAAARLATRRIRASGYAPLVRTLPVSGTVARRTAAALLFPIALYDMRRLHRYIIAQSQTVNP